MQETQVQSLGQQDPLKEEIATHSSIPAQKIPRMRSLMGYHPWGCKNSDMTEGLSTHTIHSCFLRFQRKVKQAKVFLFKPEAFLNYNELSLHLGFCILDMPVESHFRLPANSSIQVNLNQGINLVKGSIQFSWVGASIYTLFSSFAGIRFLSKNRKNLNI